MTEDEIIEAVEELLQSQGREHEQISKPELERLIMQVIGAHESRNQLAN